MSSYFDISAMLVEDLSSSDDEENNVRVERRHLRDKSNPLELPEAM